MNKESFEDASYPEELQGKLKHAVDAIRAIPPEIDSEKQARERASRWAAASTQSTRQVAVVEKPTRGLLMRNRRIWWPVAAAAVVLVICFILFPASKGSNNLLAEVFQALDRAQAYHFLKKIHKLGDDGPKKTLDIWIVQGVGCRIEVHEGDKLTWVGVDNLRWEFNWNIATNWVSARPSQMPINEQSMDQNLLFENREKILDWGEKHKADIKREKDSINGREVEKIILAMPGGAIEVIWIDPKSMRPVKAFSKAMIPPAGDPYGPPMAIEDEVFIDYPAPDTLPAEKFTFQVPPDAQLEIHDPQLGRFISSEGQKSTK
jgi:hypothetical protein